MFNNLYKLYGRTNLSENWSRNAPGDTRLNDAKLKIRNVQVLQGGEIKMTTFSVILNVGSTITRGQGCKKQLKNIFFVGKHDDYGTL